MKKWVGNPSPTDGGVLRLAWFYGTGVIMSPYLGQIDTKTVSFHTQLKLGKILMRKQNLNPLFRALKRILRRTTFEPLGTLSMEFLT